MKVAQKPKKDRGNDKAHAKHCTRCHRDLPIEEFAKSQSHSDGLACICKYCQGRASTDHKAINFLAWLIAKAESYHGREDPIPEVELSAWQTDDLQHYLQWVGLRLGEGSGQLDFWRGKFGELDKMDKRFDWLHPVPYWAHHPFKDELAGWANLESDYISDYEGWEWWDEWLLANPVDSWTEEEIESGAWPPESYSLFDEKGSYHPKRIER